MQPITADIVAHVRFYTPSEGGRQAPTPPDKFGCLFELNGECFDCRLLLDDVGALQPGQQAKVPIKFLSSRLPRHRLRSGQRFHLREAGTIAEGYVEKILCDVPATPTHPHGIS
jgi:hypothetical protein